MKATKFDVLWTLTKTFVKFHPTPNDVFLSMTFLILPNALWIANLARK